MKFTNITNCCVPTCLYMAHNRRNAELHPQEKVITHWIQLKSCLFVLPAYLCTAVKSALKTTPTNKAKPAVLIGHEAGCIIKVSPIKQSN